MAKSSLDGPDGIENILQVNTSAHDGGAAQVMLRLHQQFRLMGIESWIINKKSEFRDQNIVSLDQISSLPALARRIQNSIAGRIDRWTGFPYFHGSISKIIDSPYFSKAEVVHIHNLHGRYLNYLAIFEHAGEKPFIWTLHDMWAFTGHCTYSYDCHRWKNGCGDCPLFSSENKSKIHPPATWVDGSNFFWKAKIKAFNSRQMHIVSPSRWLYNLAKESFLGERHHIHHIANGIDLDIFRPIDNRPVRARLGIPQDIPVVLFISADIDLYRKGVNYLYQAFQKLPSTTKLHLLIVGKQTSNLDRIINFPHTYLGLIRDEKQLNEIYNAADIFAFPSLADNHPLVALEALASGTPVIAFDTGGVPEIVRHMKTGYLVKYADAADFANGLQSLIRDPEMLAFLSHECRSIAINEFDLDLQVNKYLSLYKDAVERNQN